MIMCAGLELCSQHLARRWFCSDCALSLNSSSCTSARIHESHSAIAGTGARSSTLIQISILSKGFKGHAGWLTGHLEFVSDHTSYLSNYHDPWWYKNQLCKPAWEVFTLAKYKKSRAALAGGSSSISKPWTHLLNNTDRIPGRFQNDMGVSRTRNQLARFSQPESQSSRYL